MAWTDKRPMSPHLQIYKLPLTAIVSILHRATGVALSVGALFLGWILAMAALGPESYTTAHAIVSSWFGHLILFGFTVAFYFHLCSGIRHLFWDIGMGLELEDAGKSSKAILAATAALTLITWLIAL